MLFNEPKLLKSIRRTRYDRAPSVSVLFNEPKLLKFGLPCKPRPPVGGFSALQRAEIAEIHGSNAVSHIPLPVSVLFNEPKLLKSYHLQDMPCKPYVSVLFNEPKLLKYGKLRVVGKLHSGFSALQRAEIAEIF